MPTLKFVILSIVILLSLNSYSLTIHTQIHDLSEILTDIENIQNDYKDNQILIVFDIDDTLLTMTSLTQKNLPEILHKVQSQFKTICLTARPRQFFFLTKKQFEVYDLNFSKTMIGESWGKSQKIPGLRRKVFYNDGVMYASNQNKGVVLNYLLQSLYQGQSPFKQIVFVDDKEYNTQNVYDVFQPLDIEIAAYQYQRD